MLLSFFQSLPSLLVNKLIWRTDRLCKKLAIHNIYKHTVPQYRVVKQTSLHGTLPLQVDSNYKEKATVQAKGFCKEKKRKQEQALFLASVMT